MNKKNSLKKELSVLEKFIRLLNNRSKENNDSFKVLFNLKLYGNCMSILRQELDSMVRVIFLLTLNNLQVRENFILQTLKGEKWIYFNEKNKKIIVTDKVMVNLSNKLNGWTESVYKFGCSFIHLSNFHDYSSEDPFKSLPDNEKDNIIKHMDHYHHVSLNRASSINEILPHLNKVMDKVSGNYLYYVEELEKGKVIKIDEV